MGSRGVSVAGVLGRPGDGAAEPPDGERTIAARDDRSGPRTDTDTPSARPAAVHRSVSA